MLLEGDHHKKKKKKHKHKEHKSLRRDTTIDGQDSEVFSNAHLNVIIDGVLDRYVSLVNCAVENVDLLVTSHQKSGFVLHVFIFVFAT